MGTVGGVVDEGSGDGSATGARSADGGDVSQDGPPPAGADARPPRRRAGASTGASGTSGGASTTWSVNWGGAIGVLVAAVVVLIVWQQVEGSDDGERAQDDRAAPAASTSPATTAPTTAAPTTTTSTTAAPTTTADPRRVLIRGEVKPCKFGRECLVAHFEIDGFDPHPGSYACIYSNSLSGFEFNDADVDDACITGDSGDTITIEVAGVRSATISEDDLTPGT